MDEEYKMDQMEQQWLGRAVRWCAQGEQCSPTVRGKLREWGATATAVEHIVAYLVENGYVDDGRYAALYCDSKVRLQHWGRVKIAAQLRAKGLDKVIVDEALAGIDEEEYLEVLHEATEKKWLSLNESDPRRRRAKMMSFLAGRGYTMEEINQALKEMNAEY
ncbi:MAG: RecX family transcriptional regulator [Bacteroidales bacterium]|nr:RecX family transcriptional regulator [Bacteroidales bacterium]